jgi:hypothetical protein
MTKCWLIPFFMAGLWGDKAFADCLPAHDTPASVIEYFQKFNKPLPEQFCAKEAPPQASHEPPQDFSQTEKAPDQYGDDDGPGDGPFSQYEGDLGRGYRSDQGGRNEREQEGGYESDQGGVYVTKTAVMREAGVTSVTKAAVTRGTDGAITRVTQRALTTVAEIMTATTIGKMTTSAIKAASIGKAMANTENAMASASPRAKKPT